MSQASWKLKDIADGPHKEHLKGVLEQSFAAGTREHNLLVYLAAKSLREDGSPITQKTICWECFPNVPNLKVGDLAQKVRSKLDHHYTHTKNAPDAFRMEIPKGHYHVIFETGSLPDGATSDIRSTLSDNVLLHDLAGQCAQGDMIRICVTAFSTMRDWEESLGSALDQRAKIELIISHPESCVAGLRSLATGGNVSQMARDTAERLQALSSKGGLEVKVSGEYLSTGFFEIKQRQFFTILWSHRTGGPGPIFEVRAGSHTADLLARQFRTLWKRAVKYEDLTRKFPPLNESYKPGGLQKLLREHNAKGSQ